MVKNNIYNQRESECTVYAACNALEKQRGVIIPQEEIEGFFAKHNLKRDTGLKMTLVRALLKTHGIMGYKAKDMTKIYDIDRGVKNKEIEMMNFKKLANENVLILCLYHREKEKGGSRYPLDKKNVLKPLKTPIEGGGHAVFVDSAKKRFKIENTSGERFGDRGYFYLEPEDFWTEVYAAYKIVW